jgi:hypothetical protein
MPTNNPDHDPTNSNSQSTTNEDLTGNDEIDFQLDIVDGEAPSHALCNDRVRTDPPGPGPTPHTRFAILQDSSFAIIERAALGAWISADEVFSLGDAR